MDISVLAPASNAALAATIPIALQDNFPVAHWACHAVGGERVLRRPQVM
jgi:hypothetical protein